jgi:ASC-1-like (ASCH) protein
MKNKNMKIYLKPEYSRTKEEAKKVKNRLAYTKLKDVLNESEIIYLGSQSYTDTDEEREFIRSYTEFAELFDLERFENEELSPWMIRFVFDKESLVNRNISILEIQEKINEKGDKSVQCLFSDDSAANVVMRIRFVKDSSGNFLDFMRDFEKRLTEMTIRGVDGIEMADLDEKGCLKWNPDGSYTATKEWVINTKGSNILDIYSDPAVDISRTETNDIIEFAEIFGIEAARNMLCQEYNIVYQSNGVNQRHIELICDLMCYRGKLMQLERHGTNKNPDIGPIGKASFEATMDVFIKAALFSEKDNMKGVSANIFAGQFCKAGTNFFDIVMDDEKLMREIPQNEFKPEDIIREVDENDIDGMMEDMYKDMKPEDDLRDEDFNFGFGLEKEKQTVLVGPVFSHFNISDVKDGSIRSVMMNQDEMNEKLVIPRYPDEIMNQNRLVVPEIMVENNEDKIVIPQYPANMEEDEKLMIPDVPNQTVIENEDRLVIPEQAESKEENNQKPKRKSIRKKKE